MYLDLFDALLDEQTRRHADNDIVVSETEAQILRKALREAGFGDIPRDDTRAWNFVWGNRAAVRSTSMSSSWTTPSTASTAQPRT
ncbi:MAG: nucleotidyltransferase domain-containing protein [Acidimicrobiia bacterium]